MGRFGTPDLILIGLLVTLFVLIYLYQCYDDTKGKGAHAPPFIARLLGRTTYVRSNTLQLKWRGQMWELSAGIWFHIDTGQWPSSSSW